MFKWKKKKKKNLYVCCEFKYIYLNMQFIMAFSYVVVLVKREDGPQNGAWYMVHHWLIVNVC